MPIERIILGSQSPRRREYIQYLGYPVISIAPDIEETYPGDLDLRDVPLYLAKLKAKALELKLHPGEILITSDTVVILKDELIGKPIDEKNAVELLTKLSGNTHEVVTGVVIQSDEKKVTFSVSTLVTFVELKEEEILTYVQDYKPLDKAGAYGIQEYIGFIAVEQIQGSYMNVIGLPLSQIKEKLKLF